MPVCASWEVYPSREGRELGSANKGAKSGTGIKITVEDRLTSRVVSGSNIQVVPRSLAEVRVLIIATVDKSEEGKSISGRILHSKKEVRGASKQMKG